VGALSFAQCRTEANVEILQKGRYRVRFASLGRDFETVFALRQRVFRANATASCVDTDRFDASARHMMVEDVATGALVCCFRVLSLANGSQINDSYAAQYYELNRLAEFPDRLLEIGRFCTRPGRRDADVLRVAWGAIARYIAQSRTKMMFGCTSFAGVNPEIYADSFALLRDRHLAPDRWLPALKSKITFSFRQDLQPNGPDLTCAIKAMPPLLRSYLALGGRVSDHAVIDRDLNTMHVFTGLQIDTIPPRRAALLKSIFA